MTGGRGDTARTSSVMLHDHVFGRTFLVQVYRHGSYSPRRALTSATSNSSGLTMKAMEQRRGPSVLMFPGHLMEACVLRCAIFFVNSSPHFGHLNGQRSSSSYMRRFPVTGLYYATCAAGVVERFIAAPKRESICREAYYAWPRICKTNCSRRCPDYCSTTTFAD